MARLGGATHMPPDKLGSVKKVNQFLFVKRFELNFEIEIYELLILKN